MSGRSEPSTDARAALRARRDELSNECERLREDLEKYEDFYENAPDMYALLDANTATILECNNTMVRLFGRKREDILGKHIFEFHPADWHAPLTEIIEAFRETGESPDAELEYLRGDGSRAAGSAKVSPVYDENGRIVGARSAMRDITSQKQLEADLRRSEEQFRRIAETIQMVPWEARFTDVTDDDTAPGILRLGSGRRGRLSMTYVGPQSAGMSGFASTNDQMSKFWWRTVHPDDREAIAGRLLSLLANGGTDSLEYRIVGGDGRTIWLLNQYSVVADPDGSITLTGVVIDITDRKVVTDRRDRVMRELDHRVKNTLAVVGAVADRTRKTAQSWEAFRTLLSARVRTLSRIHSALSEHDWLGMGMDALVHAACGENDRLRSFGSKVSVPLEIAQPLGMVLAELATNAQKHGALSVADGTAMIRWSLVDHASTGRSLRIEWSEHGGPRPLTERPPGYGTYLLEEALPYEVDAEVRPAFNSGGFRCSLLIPVPQAQSR